MDPCCIEEDRHDVPLKNCWYARPQLFFTCVPRLKDGRLPKNRTYKTGPDDIIYTLVFFSTFEELKLPIKGPIEDAGVIKLYEPSPTPCLNVADDQKSPLSHCFWLVTRLQQSLTCSASTRMQASSMAVPTLLQRTDGGAAMSMRCQPVAVAVWAWQAPPGMLDHRRDLGKAVAVAVWARQAPPWGPVHQADWGEEASRK